MKGENMYGLMFPDGSVDFWTSDLDELRDDLHWVKWCAKTDSDYEDAEPVVQVGTSSADMQWETFEDARIEIPDWWWARVAEENE